MTINKQTARFAMGTDEVTVLLKPGKNGISVFVRTRRQGEKAVLGCRNVYLEKNVAEAQKEFDRLVAQTESKGYTRRTSGTGATTSHFSEVPAPGHLPAGKPLVAKTAAKPELRKVSGKKA